MEEPVVSVLRLPDGRWAARNERDLSDLTVEELAEIVAAFELWAEIHWRKLFWK